MCRDNIKPLVHSQRFHDGHRGGLRLRVAAAARAAARGLRGSTCRDCSARPACIALPGVLPDGIDLNTALRPFNGLLLIGLALGGGVLARALSTRAVVYLGKASYAMYILHVPMLWWYLRRSTEFPPLLYIAIVIAVSALVYGLFEEPANRWLRFRVQAALQT